MSVSTVFSTGSPVSPENDSKDLSTLAAFVAHIERLQDQVKQKDALIAELQSDKAQLQQHHGQLEREYNEIMLQADIQNDLLRKTCRADTHVEQLRAAVIDREAIIREKDRSLRAVERQLEHHKLLLQAEIRRHATIKVNTGAEHDPLPELTSLARKEDIDRWISQLTQRLQKDLPISKRSSSADGIDAQMQNLRREIDFYVREIIYYKLDVRGYKSDIRKLKKITAQLNSFGGRTSDLDSDTSSLRPAITPSRSHFPTPEVGVSLQASPVIPGPVSVSASIDRSTTPKAVDSALDTTQSDIPTDRQPTQEPEIDLAYPTSSQGDHELTGKARGTDAGVASRSMLAGRQPTVRDSAVSCGNTRV